MIYGYLPNIAAIPVPIPKPPEPSYEGLSEFDRLYVPRPRISDERLAYLVEAFFRVARAEIERDRVLADNNRLEDENAGLRDQLVWWQKEHGFQRMNGEFGTEVAS